MTTTRLSWFLINAWTWLFHCQSLVTFQQQQILTFSPSLLLKRTATLCALEDEGPRGGCSSVLLWYNMEESTGGSCLVLYLSGGAWIGKAPGCRLLSAGLGKQHKPSTQFLQVLLAAAKAFPAVCFKPNELVLIHKRLCVLHLSLLKNVGFDA